MDRELALNALLMAVWRRQPKETVLVHSDQGSQFSSYDWQDFLKAHNLQPSMSRRGNCHDNAVAENFFQLLKRERIRRRIYKDREESWRDIFDYIEMFYNPKRRHSYSKGLSSINYERQYEKRLMSVKEIGGDSRPVLNENSGAEFSACQHSIAQKLVENKFYPHGRIYPSSV